MKVLALTPDATPLLQLLASQVERGLELVIEPSLRAGLKRLRESAWSIVLVDSILDDEIVDVVEQIAASRQRVVLLVRYVSVELILAALRRGAWDILRFPLEEAELRDVIGRAKATGIPPSSVSVPVGKASGNVTFVGESPKVAAAVEMATCVADSVAPVLIQGERGTGKELLGRFLHGRSRRREGPFVVVECARMPEEFLESELFGREERALARAGARRAGRFERASGGTLFLDEVGDLSLPVQAKVLRALQEREIEGLGGQKPIAVDVRVAAATTRTLEDEVAAGRFREDLYYLLASVVLSLPPLRERADDIRLLAEHCVAKAAHEHGWHVRAIANETLDCLRNYPWPGNVRQLCNVMERSLLAADGPVLLPAHLPPKIRTHSFEGQRFAAERQPNREHRERYDESDETPLPLEALERVHISKALAFTGGHIGRAADLLGIHRNTLRRKLRSRELGAEFEPGRGGEGTVQTAHTDAPPSS